MALLAVLISIITINTPFSYPLFIIGYYSYFFSFSFLVIFSWLILKVDKNFSLKFVIILIILYAFSSGCIVGAGILINGIQYGLITGWVPIFTLEFAIISWIYIAFAYFIPEVILSIKSLRIFKKSPMSKKINLLFIILLMEVCLAALPILYNYWFDNHFYRAIIPFIALPLSTISAYITYRILIKGFS